MNFIAEDDFLMQFEIIFKCLWNPIIVLFIRKITETYVSFMAEDDFPMKFGIIFNYL